MQQRNNDYEEKSQHNPWISFSDLFCGLLLVFVLLFFFAIYRYVGAKEMNDADTLKLQQEMISEQEEVLALYKADADDQKAAYAAQSQELEDQKAAFALQSQELEDQKALIALTQSDLDDRLAELAEQESELALSQAKAAEKESELALAQAQIDEKESELALSQEKIAEKERELGITHENLANKEDELASVNLTVAEQESELEASKLTISDQQELLNAQKALLEEQALKLEEIVGVRKALIQALNDRLGEKQIQVQADPSTGAIAFESEILFEFDRSELKEEGKEFFSTFMPVYMSVLLQPEFRDYIGEVIIEGHTDQQGEYFHNLQLSQQRAFSVSEYILRNETNFLENDVLEELKSLITVNGCADRNLIYNEDGSINEDKSRRVEVKFRLKDQEMIDEMNKILSVQEEG